MSFKLLSIFWFIYLSSGSVFQVLNNTFIIRTVPISLPEIQLPGNHTLQNNVVSFIRGSDSCNNLNNLTGRIIMMEYNKGCSLSHKLSIAQSGGAVAVLMIVPFRPGHLSTSTDLKEVITIPCFEVQDKDVLELIKYSEKVNHLIIANLTESDNEWIKIFNGPLFISVQVILTGFYSGVMIYLIYTIYYHYKERGLMFSVTWVTFILEFIGLSLMIMASVDLGWSRRLFDQNGGIFLTQLYCQSAVLTNLLMAFYFLELFGDKLDSQSLFLERYRIIFMSILVAGFTVRLILLFLQVSYKITSALDTVIGGVILVIQISISLFLLLGVVIKSNRKLIEFEKEKNFKRLVDTVNIFVGLCGVGSLLFLLAVLTLTVFTPLSSVSYWGNIALSISPILLGFVTMVKIHRLSPHNQIRKTTTSKKEKNTTTIKSTGSSVM